MLDAPSLARKATARAILAGIRGGVVMMLSTGGFTPLEAALDLAIDHLRDHPPRPSASALTGGRGTRGSRVTQTISRLLRAAADIASAGPARFRE
jgi:hypothetical protein